MEWNETYFIIWVRDGWPNIIFGIVGVSLLLSLHHFVYHFWRKAHPSYTPRTFVRDCNQPTKGSIWVLFCFMFVHFSSVFYNEVEPFYAYFGFVFTIYGVVHWLWFGIEVIRYDQWRGGSDPPPGNR